MTMITMQSKFNNFIIQFNSSIWFLNKIISKTPNYYTYSLSNKLYYNELTYIEYLLKEPLYNSMKTSSYLIIKLTKLILPSMLIFIILIIINL
jgi:hypothetical protein